MVQGFDALIARLGSLGLMLAFRHRDFALYSASSWVSLIGMWVQRIGIGWLTWDLTHSAAWLGGIALAQSAPAMLFTPLTGAVADRLDRMKILRFSQFVSLVLAATLAGLTFAGQTTEYVLLVFSVVTGLNQSLSMPARLTLTPALVPRADLSAAIAAGSFLFTSANFVGPALSGIIIAHAGIAYAFALNAVTFLPALWVLFVIRPLVAEHRVGGRSLFGDVADGVRYVARHQGIGPVLLIAFCASICVRHLPDLMPGFAGAVFHAGPQGLATLMAAFGIGGMAGSLWMANRNQVAGTTRLFFGALLAISGLVFAFAVTGWFELAVPLVVLIGISGSLTGSGAQVLIQNAVEGHMRARVMSLYSLTFRGAPALGAMIVGGLATLVGLPVAAAGGAACLFVLSLGALPRWRVVEASLEVPPPEPAAADRPRGPGSKAASAPTC